MNACCPIHQFILGVLICVTPCPAQSELDQGPDAFGDEPPTRVVVMVGNHATVAELGRPIELVFDGKRQLVTIIPDSHKTFEHGPLRFEYPSNMSFGYALHEGTAHEWKLKGPDVVLQVLWMPDPDFAAGPWTDAFAVTIRKKYGLKDAELTPEHLEFGGFDLTGYKLAAPLIGGELIVQSFCSIDTIRGPVMFVLTQSPPDLADDTDGYVELMASLKDSLRVETHANQAGH